MKCPGVARGGDDRAWIALELTDTLPQVKFRSFFAQEVALRLFAIFNLVTTPPTSFPGSSFYGGTILTTKLLLISNYYIFKAKAPTTKPFADTCSIEESFLVLKSRPYLTSHVITTEKTLKLKRHIVLYTKININSNLNRKEQPYA